MTAAYLAIDWGTTNRRIYALDQDGRVERTERDDRGVVALAADDYSTEILAMRERFGKLPILAAGMVGSTRGWRETAYLSLPVDLTMLAKGVARFPEEDVMIIPGLALRSGSRGDVMRGEEVQVLGAAAAGLVPTSSRLCQPGTHNKWVRLQQGQITDFTTVMTGEMFTLLREHSILRDALTVPVVNGPAFEEGVLRSKASSDLLGDLFGVRGSVLLGMRPIETAAAYASGLLIGADVAARSPAPEEPIHILADPALGRLYSSAIELLGGRARLVDSQAAFVAGIHQIWRNLS